MTSKPEKVYQLTFRVYADEDGEVYLLLLRDGVEYGRKPVERRVSRKHLREARFRLLTSIPREPRTPPTPPQQEAQREIKVALHPWRAGDWLNLGDWLRRVENAAQWIVAVPFIIFCWLLIISFAYKPLSYSSKYLPEPIHLAILVLYGLAVILLVRLIAIKIAKWERGEKVNAFDLLFLIGITLSLAVAVFASLTFVFYSYELINLEPCRGTAVSQETLLDFYLWHLLKLVPLVDVNEGLKWSEPFCYSQTRVGALILLFQTSVVVPCIGAVRFYWQNRRKFRDREDEFVYDEIPDGN